jgi:hypothetical protein
MRYVVDVGQSASDEDVTFSGLGKHDAPFGHGYGVSERVPASSDFDTNEVGMQNQRK